MVTMDGVQHPQTGQDLIHHEILKGKIKSYKLSVLGIMPLGLIVASETLMKTTVISPSPTLVSTTPPARTPPRAGAPPQSTP